MVASQGMLCSAQGSAEGKGDIPEDGRALVFVENCAWQGVLACTFVFKDLEEEVCSEKSQVYRIHGE